MILDCWAAQIPYIVKNLHIPNLVRGDNRLIAVNEDILKAEAPIDVTE